MDDRRQDTENERPRMSGRRRFIVFGRWALVVAWAAVVYFGPAVSAPSPVAYFIEFAVLSFLLANALWQHMGLLTACAVAVLVTCVLGIADGAVSLMVPDHPFSLFDWVVGAGGALVGGIAAHPALRVIDSFVSSDL
ncbi:Tat pathway signal protein [Eggerthella sp. NSJ-70]|uniref:Tat pathway signal protein n=1 Tax=Eggerthella hominis TaxID=2763043 RepID=A0ABR7BN29_9ACTN|nr:Tat pathway signal protein [Eggerthella hominis]MBC5583008.1 Tat pathway signal protein [Eggerthella hominis]